MHHYHTGARFSWFQQVDFQMFFLIFDIFLHRFCDGFFFDFGIDFGSILRFFFMNFQSKFRQNFMCFLRPLKKRLLAPLGRPWVPKSSRIRTLGPSLGPPGFLRVPQLAPKWTPKSHKININHPKGAVFAYGRHPGADLGAIWRRKWSKGSF